ncbi:MAG TPA: hypothetical protein VHO48_07455 [Anaerolineaceae bacterium]|nr:hypothetical protein [Anaerolineaceae bacterium]
MSRIEKIIERLRRSRWAPAFFALLGAALYLAQAARIARLLVSSLDEGNYLVKGLLFVTGVYTPLYNICIEDADFALIKSRAYIGQFDQATTYQELEPTVTIYPCRPGSEIRIFRRIQ